MSEIIKDCDTCKHEISSICLECNKNRIGWETKPLDNLTIRITETNESKMNKVLKTIEKWFTAD